MITAPLVSDTDSLADLEYSLDRLHSEDLGPGVGAGLGPRLHALYRAVNRLQAETARTLEAFDRFEAYRADGALSAPCWWRPPGSWTRRPSATSLSTSVTAWTPTARNPKMRQLLTRESGLHHRKGLHFAT